MSNPTGPMSKYLDPQILTRLGPLDIVARQVVEGVRIGMHRSPQRGISTEFTTHRPYVAGDEIKHIDWKIYGRERRYYIKQYEAETNFVANLLLDASSSMHYASGAISKLEYAKFMAAAMAFLVTDQRDSVGLGVFDSALRNYIEPKSSSRVVHDMAAELEKVKGEPRTDVGAILHEFARRMARRGVVALFSDLLDNTDAFIHGINHLRFRGHNVIVFHILDPYELEFPFRGMWKFVGLENDGDIVTQPNRVRAGYLRELEKFIVTIKDACMRAGVDYVLVNTARPVEQTLSAYLIQRTMLRRAGTGR